jgi:2-keto-myo-inositol isomerase
MFPFKFSLNASTLFPFKLNVKDQVEVAAKAGYEGIELWVRDIEAYVQQGGSISELRKFIEASGISVVNAIAFFAWTDADDAARERGFEQAKREMEMLTELGCAAVAAPPFGNVEGVSLDAMARNFRKLAELARDIGIEPYLEFWGRAKRLSRLSEAVYVAIESGVDNAKLLLDPFHMYTGGSRIEDLKLLSGKGIGIVHVNDYPASPAREVIADSDRVFPGDGVAPMGQFAKLLAESGYNGYLSLELFISDFGNQTALQVAAHGLDKVKGAFHLS